MPSHPYFPVQDPSPWITRFAGLPIPGVEVLDLACGTGRHARWFAGRGFSVVAADRDATALTVLDEVPGVRTLCVDLEGEPWPWTEACFDAVVVTRYLFRPRLAMLATLLRPGGVLIYETFMIGNARFGKPSNPDFLLQPDELFDWARGWGRVLAFEQGEIAVPAPAMIQRVCAVRTDAAPRLP